jgi:hypothetical protein
MPDVNRSYNMDKTFKELFDDLPDDEPGAIMITPEMAAELLSINSNNSRIPHEATIQKYVEAMLAGDWELKEDEPLYIDVSTLEPLDGRMRLRAHVRAGMAIRYYIRKAKHRI